MGEFAATNDSHDLEIWLDCSRVSDKGKQLIISVLNATSDFEEEQTA